MRCGECGKKGMTYQSIKGKSFSWKDYPGVIIDSDLELNTCSDCGNIGVWAGECEKIDEAIENSLHNQINSFLQKIDKKDLVGIDLSELPNYEIFKKLKSLSERVS